MRNGVGEGNIQELGMWRIIYISDIYAIPGGIKVEVVYEKM